MHKGQEPRVLVTGVGGAAGIAVLRALADRPYRLLGADCDPHAAGIYLAPEGGLLLPRADDADYVEAVFDAVSRHGVDILVPTVDEELQPLARERGRLEGLGVHLLAAPESALRLCLDKWALVCALAGEVPVPRTSLLDDRLDLAELEPPLVVKPRSGRGGEGISFHAEVAELAGRCRDGSWIAQEELPGAEYSIDVLVSQAGEAVAAVPRERLKVDSGVAVTARTVRDPELEELGRRAALAAGLRGPANVQFRRDRDGTPRLLEINPRFPGTLAITVASGVNLPDLAIADLLGSPLPDAAGHFDEVAIVRYLEEKVLEPGRLEEMEGCSRGFAHA